MNIDKAVGGGFCGTEASCIVKGLVAVGQRAGWERTIEWIREKEGLMVMKGNIKQGLHGDIYILKPSQYAEWS